MKMTIIFLMTLFLCFASVQLFSSSYYVGDCSSWQATYQCGGCQFLTTPGLSCSMDGQIYEMHLRGSDCDPGWCI